MLEKSCKTILSVTKHKVWFPSVVSVTLPYSLFLLKKNDDKKKQTNKQTNKQKKTFVEMDISP